MSSSSPGASKIAEWRSVRRLFPIYADLAETFDLGDPPYTSLDGIPDQLETEAVGRVQAWLSEVDERIKPHQLRQMLQSTGIAQADEKLRALIRRYLNKRDHSDLDRDKLDFLITQYLFVCAPPSFSTRDATLEEVAEVLEPVLGECPTQVPSWLEPLARLMEQMKACASLQELESLQIVQHGRDIKASAGERFFGITALLTFAYFTYSLRRTFARLSAAELAEIEHGLLELEARSINGIDGNEAGLATNEPLESVRQLLQTLTSTAAPEYGSDDTVSRLIALRRAVESRLEVRTTFTEAEDARGGGIESEVGELRRRLTEVQREMESLRGLIVQLSAEVEEIEMTLRQTSLVTAANMTPTAPGPPQESNAEPLENPFAMVQDGGLRTELENTFDHLRKRVKERPAGAIAVVKIGGAALLLSEGELRLLSYENQPSDESGKLLARALSARAFIVEQLQMIKVGTAIDLAPLLHLAKDFVQQMRGAGGRHGLDHDAIAAAARQLATVIQQAEASSRRTL